jgi:hypothetical protein
MAAPRWRAGVMSQLKTITLVLPALVQPVPRDDVGRAEACELKERRAHGVREVPWRARRGGLAPGAARRAYATRDVAVCARWRIWTRVP